MIHLITYGVGKRFEYSKKRLCLEARRTGWFNTIKAYGFNDLDSDFKKKFKNILNQSKGAGYWIWKAHIIKKRLQEIKDGDILIYLDAGCSINSFGKKRFLEYIDMLNKSNTGIISFENSYIEKHWTTREIFEYFNIDLDETIANTSQLIGGVRIMKKNKNLIKLINLELETYSNKPLLVTDHYNKNQANYFKENRHEQSIFSIIRKMHNPIILKDETFFGQFNNFGNKQSFQYPFWTPRGVFNKTTSYIFKKLLTTTNKQKINIYRKKNKNIFNY